MTDRRKPTDREAIRRLAEMVSRHAVSSGLYRIHEDARNLISDLSEPAAPTVTREQAEQVKSAVGYYFDTKDYGAKGPDWPAFFRAVADALEGEA